MDFTSYEKSLKITHQRQRVNYDGDWRISIMLRIAATNENTMQPPINTANQEYSQGEVVRILAEISVWLRTLRKCK